MTKLAVKIRLKQNGGKIVTLVGFLCPKKKKKIIKFVIDLALDLSETCGDHVVTCRHKRPGSTPFPSMWALWWTKWHSDLFCPSNSGSLCQHHSASAP